MDIKMEDLNEKAQYKKVSKIEEEFINRTRVYFSDIYDYIEQNCNSSRETSLALTKLEECQFWLIKSITRNGYKTKIKEQED